MGRPCITTAHHPPTRTMSEGGWSAITERQTLKLKGEARVASEGRALEHHKCGPALAHTGAAASARRLRGGQAPPLYG